MIDLASKELSARALFTNSWKVFFKNIKNYFWLLIIYALIGVAIAWITAGIFWLLWGFDTTKTSLDNYSIVSLIIMAIIWIAAVVVFVYVAVIYSIALLHTIHQNLIGNTISIKSAIEYGRNAKISRFFNLGLIKGLYLFLLTLLFIIPWVIYALYWTFTASAFIVDDKWYPEALDASKALVKGRRWKLFGKFLVVGLIYIGIFIVIWIPLIFIIVMVTKSGTTTWQELPMSISIIGDIIQQVVTQSITIVWAIISMMIYLNRKHIFNNEPTQATTTETTIAESSNPFDK